MKRILIGVAGVVLALVVILYAGSEWVIRSGHALPAAKIAIPTDAASIAEGGRLARVEGCRNCHGADGEGKVLADDMMFGRIATPPLAKIAAGYGDEELVRAIRHGVRKDGSSLWVMPTNAYTFIADDDLGKIIAWIRTLKPGPKDSLATMRFGPVARGLILFGKFPPSFTAVSPAEKTRPADTGRYLADAVCTGCHALDRPRPVEDGSVTAPALAPMAAAYDLPSFTRLLRTGQGISDRKLGLMREVSLVDFTHMTDDEIAKLHAYLVAEAAKQAK